MPHLSPSEALIACERALRLLFGRVYAEAYGSGWLSRIADEERIARWRERREDEERRRTRKGALAVPERDELAYAEFYELLAIADKHWQPLAPALGKRSTTLPLLRRFESLRNTIAHSREPLAFEADLLSGIAGEMQNRVTIYMTTSDPSGDHYPRIESATDSFGRHVGGDPSRPLRGADETVEVNVGDTITFDCVGSDAQGRALTWEATNVSMGRQVGERVSLRWQVAESDVQETVYVFINLASDGRYHRHGQFDDRVHFKFRVPPPPS